jgi:hypothetical protein
VFQALAEQRKFFLGPSAEHAASAAGQAEAATSKRECSAQNETFTLQQCSSAPHLHPK